MIRDETKDAMLAWQRLMLGLVTTISYRLAGTEPTKIFFEEIAESLESLAARVRREIK